MVEIELDGKSVEVPQGSMVMHAANKLGTYIPHFCYHKKLSIAANCRRWRRLQNHCLRAQRQQRKA